MFYYNIDSPFWSKRYFFKSESQQYVYASKFTLMTDLIAPNSTLPPTIKISLEAGQGSNIPVYIPLCSFIFNIA